MFYVEQINIVIECYEFIPRSDQVLREKAGIYIYRKGIQKKQKHQGQGRKEQCETYPAPSCTSRVKADPAPAPSCISWVKGVGHSGGYHGRLTPTMGTFLGRGCRVIRFIEVIHTVASQSRADALRHPEPSDRVGALGRGASSPESLAVVPLGAANAPAHLAKVAGGAGHREPSPSFVRDPTGRAIHAS